MARARRRSGRTQTEKTPDTVGATDDDAQTQPAQEENGNGEDNGERDEDDKCPACKDIVRPEGEPIIAADKEKWVRCDACKTWFHWRCVGEGGDLDAVGKWFCRPCLDADPARVITMKPPARKSARKKTQRDYAGLNAGNEADPSRFLRMMEGKVIKRDPFARMLGSEVGIEWLEGDESAMKEPILVETDEGLGMKMPPAGFTVDDVVEALGEDHPVEVIDVATQSNTPNWTLGKWLEYWNTEPLKRDKIRNVISLEISGTPLADKVLPPRIVRELDWVEKFWPNTKKGRGHNYPKVQLYCLMGVGGAWTDWHVDFAGSSVYYHILHGAKVFYFIRPSPANLAAYERWSGTEVQNHSWLGDMCDEVFKVELTTGNTMIIPTGWIHAVYTPVDTLVFGGNFLHSYNVPTQLRVREIEIATHVPKKFRFPFFARLCWYAGEKYLRDLKAKEEFSPRVLDSVEALAEFLVAESRTIERGVDPAKRQAKEEVPGDRIKDAPALARELRWRVRHAAGYASDDDGRSHRKTKAAVNGDGSTNGTGNKRKRTALDEDGIELFRNYKRASWDRVEDRPTERESKLVRARRPNTRSKDWVREWTSEDGKEEQEDGDEVHVERKRDVIVKVRKTAKGLERHRVERVLENWVWHAAPSSASSSAPNSKREPVADAGQTAEDRPPPAASSVGTTDPDSVMHEAQDHAPIPSTAKEEDGTGLVTVSAGS